MNKQQVLQRIIERLEIDLDVAIRAAQTAYETATHEENIAENKYDTLGLEASYLAAGQARRVEEIRQSLTLYKTLVLKPFDEARGIQPGDLIVLESVSGVEQHLFLGPDAAGLKITVDETLITVITAKAPLGQNLLGKFDGDEVEISVNGSRQSFEVMRVV
ncbi:transcription elongation factor GreAB [Pseudomonas sp. Bc-h]|jgi:transcription elongation GreA/GreB family factor|uniref:GreA/GreB family elongation factor n=1 Tax=unclassified Pseudomonas TaxID=196821 RepID=UPI0009DB31ED|nr:MULTISPECIES: GreA/GreB family elongation factor [unclassified Pseudomonas]MDE1196900.1 GreA/GreB family elongation factor [Pseudomonas sp.]OQR28725.1 transcription elongation factor GreAB [Pseudomonas sp. Bc-h]